MKIYPFGFPASISNIVPIDWRLGAYNSQGVGTYGVEWNLSKGTLYPTAGTAAEITLGVGGALGITSEFHPNSTLVTGNAPINIGPMISVQKVGGGIV